MTPWPSRNSRSFRIVICEIWKCRAKSLTSTRPSRCRTPRISRRRSSLSRPFGGICFDLFRIVTFIDERQECQGLFGGLHPCQSVIRNGAHGTLFRALFRVLIRAFEPRKEL